MTVASKKIPSSDKVTAFVTFPGNEIKDLYVHEPTPTLPTAQPVVNPPVVQEATVPPPAQQPSQSVQQSSQPPLPPQKEDKGSNNVDIEKNTQSRQRTNDRHNTRSGRGQTNESREQRAPSNTGGRGRGGGRSHGRGQYNNPVPSTANATTTPQATNAGTGEHLLKSREQKTVVGRETNQQSVKTEFDFNVGLNNFNKEAVLAEVASSVVAVEAIKYNKDDFFDTFSAKSESRLSYSDERKLNQDTFGISSLKSNSSSYRGRGRGRGRGRYGGGRGRSQGNQNSATTEDK